MKSFKRYLTIIMLPFLGMLFGCNDQLDLKNIGAYAPTDVWANASTAQIYVNNCYNFTLPGGWPTLSGWDDEDSKLIQPDAVTIQNGTQKYWPYANIRRINIGLEEVAKSNLTPKDMSLIEGQLKFLRAWTYFNAVMHHGGVPIIKHPQTVDEDLYVFRNSTAECFDFIVEDLDDAIASEIPTRSSGGDYGMIDKAAAKAFKGRVLLYKASPLFNPSNPWDNAHWNTAYQANKTAYTDLLASGFALMDDYADLFSDENGQPFNNDEYILTKILQAPGTIFGWNIRGILPLSMSSGQAGWNNPPWDHVELYTMKDGKPINESTKYDYSINTYFQNRDPRFYRNIYYNGSIAEIGGNLGRRQYTTDDIGPLGEPEQFNDAVLAPGKIPKWDNTGFFSKKFIQESVPYERIEYNDVDYPIIRFAEVVLNLAEAANESGHMQEAIDLVKLIRSRAGIEAGADGNYGIDVTSRESVRAVIQNEFAVEFFQEGHRFTHIRRWRRLSEWDEKPKQLLYATVKPEYWVNPSTKEELIEGKNPALYEMLPEDFNYEVRVFVSDDGRTMRYMPDKYHFFPIQLNHIDLNENLEQNIGWGNGTFNPTLE